MFCEQCGAKLEKGIRFCENCGAPVPAENYEKFSSDTAFGKNSAEFKRNENWKSVFACENWEIEWKKSAGKGEAGIILTNSEKLCVQLSCQKQDLLNLLEDYVDFSAERGVFYHLLDFSENRISSDSSGKIPIVVEILRKISSFYPAKYLFILGNEEILEFSSWKNESGDSDQNVTSDFCYNVLNLDSPWNGAKYDFDNALRVGRLPTWNGESFSLFRNYFENAKRGIGSIAKIKTYGLSALVWQNESEDSFSKISSGKVDVSPSVTRFNVDGKIPDDANLLLFNLHGSENTEFWYGQNGAEYPEAFSPENVKSLKSPNFIGVEACYGAMYEGGKNSSSSNVLAALTNRTISLLGSSRIAYGTSNPPGSCADILVSEFLKEISENETAGDAHISALKKLYSKEMNDSDIKTLCEFSLFGDPSACIGKIKLRPSVKFFTGFSKINPERKSVSGLHIAVPDVRAAVKLELAKVDEKIAEAINSHVYKNYPEMSGIAPKTFSVGKSKLFQSIYQNQKNQVVKIYFDMFGKIKTELASK